MVDEPVPNRDEGVPRPEESDALPDQEPQGGGAEEMPTSEAAIEPAEAVV